MKNPSGLKKGIVLVGLVGVSFVIAFYTKDRVDRQGRVAMESHRTSSQSFHFPGSASATRSVAESVSAPQHHENQSPSQASREVTLQVAKQNWAEATKWIGGEVTGQFDSKGRLVALKVKGGRASHPANDFLQNPSAIRGRAKEVLERLQGVLGIARLEALVERQVLHSTVTGVVSYHQEVQGLPLLGGGSLRITFTSTGAVDSLYSDVYGDLKLVGKFAFDAEIAKSKISSPADSLRTVNDFSSSRPIAVVRGAPAGGAIAVPAYEVWNRGTQYAIHGETGQVLWKRDRRIH
jgi:hypothetical protein